MNFETILLKEQFSTTGWVVVYSSDKRTMSSTSDEASFLHARRHILVEAFLNIVYFLGHMLGLHCIGL